ncbi:hypothetical protein [Mycoplana rhizolycopersici]|nr:hypothetical protein [Rhizobium rhizolycopersici]
MNSAEFLIARIRCRSPCECRPANYGDRPFVVDDTQFDVVDR